jgi:hypothetical protein
MLPNGSLWGQIKSIRTRPDTTMYQAAGFTIHVQYLAPKPKQDFTPGVQAVYDGDYYG